MAILTYTADSLKSLKPEQIAALLNAANAKAEAANKMRIKTSEKGVVVVSGCTGKFPVSLYAEQWERVLSNGPAILAYIKDNPSLPRKG